MRECVFHRVTLVGLRQIHSFVRLVRVVRRDARDLASGGVLCEEVHAQGLSHLSVPQHLEGLALHRRRAPWRLYPMIESEEDPASQRPFFSFFFLFFEFCVARRNDNRPNRPVGHLGVQVIHSFRVLIQARVVCCYGY